MRKHPKKTSSYTLSDAVGENQTQGPILTTGIGPRIKAAADTFETRASAAKAAGVSDDMLYRYIREESPPSFSAMVGLAGASGFRLDWLATGKGEMRDRSRIPLTKPERDLLRQFDDYRQRIAAGKPVVTAMLEFSDNYNVSSTVVNHIQGIDKVSVELLSELRRRVITEGAPGHLVALEQKLVDVSLAVAITTRLVKEEEYLPTTGWTSMISALLVSGEITEEGARFIIRQLKADLPSS